MSHWVLPVLVLSVLQTLSDATTSTATQNAVQAPAPAAVFSDGSAKVMLDVTRRSHTDMAVRPGGALVMDLPSTLDGALSVLQL